VNKEYLSCDFRAGIGAFIPHSFCGFGGGYKIVMPALSHIDAIEYHHGTLLKKYWDTCYGIGRHKDNPLLEDLKECGRIARLDAVIDVMVNSLAQATDIYAGSPDGLYDTMTARAVEHYMTRTDKKADIVFANAYGKVNEAVIALSLAEEFLKDEGGDVVILCDTEGGQVVHYLLGRFGKDTWGRLAFGERKKSSKTKNIYIYSQHRDRANECWFGKREDLLWHTNLESMINILDDRYKGMGVDVLVIPDGTIQMI
jgi:nickel-dependent lactate racemase